MAGFRLRGIAYGSAAIVLGVLAACASLPGGGISKDSPIEAKRAVLTERVNARWDALLKGDLDQAYTYMSDASKQAYSLNAYKAGTKPGMWKAVKINSIDCDGEICTAGMTLTYDHRMMKGVQTPFAEQWIIEKGTAWYIYQPHG